jgi:hypothetical protein
MSGNPRRNVVILLVMALCLIVICTRTCSQTGKTRSGRWQSDALTDLMTPGMLRQADDLTEALQKTGLIDKISLCENAVFVEPVVWSAVPFGDKEKTAIAFTMHCMNHCPNSNEWVYIKDKYSGKDIAKWMRGWGLKVD